MIAASYHPLGLKCVWFLAPGVEIRPFARVDARVWEWRIDQLRELVRQRLEEM